MKDKIIELNTLCKATIGCRPQFNFVKGAFQMALLRPAPASPWKSSLSNDPEVCYDEAIEFIKSRQRPVSFNDIKGAHVNASYTIQPELSL